MFWPVSGKVWVPPVELVKVCISCQLPLEPSEDWSCQMVLVAVVVAI